MNATILTDYCLQKQAEMEKLVPMTTHLSERVPVVHPCRGCEQGKLIKKGEGDDMDVEKLKEESQLSKVCSVCGDTKSISEFYETPNGKREHQCKKCKHAAAVERRKAGGKTPGKPCGR